MVSIMNFTVGLILGCFLVNSVNAIDCYVCQGCQEVTPNDVQTCPASPVTEDPEFTTNYDGLIQREPSISRSADSVLFLEEADENAEKDIGYIIDSSNLPGADKIPLRSLKQVEDGDDARCVITVFEENGVTDVIRGCSTAADDQEARCSEAIGPSFSGSLVYCNLCGEDLCNAAPKSAVALLVLIFGVLMNLVLFK